MPPALVAGPCRRWWPSRASRGRYRSSGHGRRSPAAGSRAARPASTVTVISSGWMANDAVEPGGRQDHLAGMTDIAADEPGQPALRHDGDVMRGAPRYPARPLPRSSRAAPSRRRQNCRHARPDAGLSGPPGPRTTRSGCRPANTVVRLSLMEVLRIFDKSGYRANFNPVMTASAAFGNGSIHSQFCSAANLAHSINARTMVEMVTSVARSRSNFPRTFTV